MAEDFSFVLSGKFRISKDKIGTDFQKKFVISYENRTKSAC